ncbi:MAG: FAD-dependent oxidoreductase [Eubacteriales bacterium]|nr:FAD-dependent oxidoreductase [Eubacteriales bacterium]
MKLKRMLSVLAALVMLCSAAVVSAGAESLGFTAGTYTKEVPGMHGPLTVEVTVDENSIVDAKVVSNMETPGMGDYAGDQVALAIVESQSLDVDLVSGATVTSAIVKNAIASCLEEAGGNMDALKAARERSYDVQDSYTADVVVIGGGGAGLCATATALAEGASVVLVEATDILGGNSLVVGGFMNAPVPELQDHFLEERSASMESLITAALEDEPVSDEHKELQDAVRADYEAYLASDKTMFDSANWFALQTWNGGDKLGTLPIVRKMTGAAYGDMQWLIENGMEFRDTVTLGGGALYTRSRYAILPNGLGYITAIRSAMEKSAGDKLTILTSTKGTDLIVEDGKVVGAKAIFNRTGKEITLHANNGVVLSTGGFAGNVELRQKYCEGEKWPDLGSSVKTTNVSGVRGDGIFMAEKAGVALVNMEQIQLLPYCNPATGLVNDVVGGSNGSPIFINKEGRRFVREDGRRDEMSKGIIAQTDGIMYMFANASAYGVTDFHDCKTLGGQSVGYLLDNHLNGIVIGDTLEDIADQLGFPVENLKETLDNYNAHVVSGTADEFGRVTYSTPIEEGPYIAYPRQPAAHHTMGGVLIDENTHALTADGAIVPGLYCAGEITGVVHGTNRIGGNAIVDYLTFGREAGLHAAHAE